MDWLPEFLWTPQKRGIEGVIESLETHQSVCLQSPTGGGKTLCAAMLMRWAESQGKKTVFYVNRKLLLPQTRKAFGIHGLRCGIRAAEWDFEHDDNAPHQIASIQTEYARSVRSGRWSVFPADLIIVDEIHLQKGPMLEAIRERHGCQMIGLSATPIGLKGICDDLVISGSLNEYRECGAIVPCVVKGIMAPDMRKVKRNLVGEFVINDRTKKVFVQSIVGDVYRELTKTNPDLRPSILFAPGVQGSVYLTEYLRNRGVEWAHVDATYCVVKGKRYNLTPPLWQDLQGQHRDGKVVGISSRFKVREGVDWPHTYCGLFATPVGSVSSYIQMMGRILRKSKETPDMVVALDFGGNYIRHGSPNAERPWRDWFEMPEGRASSLRENEIREGRLREPVVCPYCFTERHAGSKCPDPPYGCGAEAQLSKRTVVMEDGSLTEVDCGSYIPKHKSRVARDTAKLWAGMFWGYRKHQVDRSFRQMRASFQYKYGYRPPDNLPYMPLTPEGWYAKPKDVNLSDLIPPEPKTGKDDQGRLF